MELKEIRMDDYITHVALIGKLDVQGLHAVDVKFHGYTAARRKPTLVDISQLEFISSLGIGMFISCARSLGRFGAKLVLFNPQPMVEEVFNAVGLGEAIPITHSMDKAIDILFPPAATT
jgi:anti-sigma B factor antagonist